MSHDPRSDSFITLAAIVFRVGYIYHDSVLIHSLSPLMRAMHCQWDESLKQWKRLAMGGNISYTELSSHTSMYSNDS